MDLLVDAFFVLKIKSHEFTLKEAGFWEVFCGEMKFVLSNFLSNEDLSISYET